MIKCNVTAVGTVLIPGEVKSDNRNNPYSIFKLAISLGSQDEPREIDVSVSMSGLDLFIMNLKKGDRVIVKGQLVIRRREDNTYYNLSADVISIVESINNDFLSGDMHFLGNISKKGVIEKNNNKGKFCFFDAYSSERTGDNKFSYLWVHFVDFKYEEHQWLDAGVPIEVHGALNLSWYNDHLNINCNISTISKWDKNQYKNQ